MAHEEEEFYANVKIKLSIYEEKPKFVCRINNIVLIFSTKVTICSQILLKLYQDNCSRQLTLIQGFLCQQCKKMVYRKEKNRVGLVKVFCPLAIPAYVPSYNAVKTGV